MKKEINYEESIQRLQQIVAALEKSDITLEQSMKLFEEGVTLVKQCGDVLSTARQKVEVLSESLEKIQQEWE